MGKGNIQDQVCGRCGGKGRHKRNCPAIQGPNKRYTRPIAKGKVSPRERKQLTKVQCPTCGGSGRRGARACGLCKGSGQVDAAR
jgi:DnaJ-class molecular chaperone